MARMTLKDLQAKKNGQKLLGKEPWSKPAVALVSPAVPSTTVTVTASAARSPLPRNGHKFNVAPKEERTCDGIVFDSKNEMRCYRVLRDQKVNFSMQPEFLLQPAFQLNGKKYRPIVYVGDFLVKHNGQEYVVDVKGFLTPDFKMKAKMLAHVHKIAIVQIRSPKQMLAWIKSI